MAARVELNNTTGGIELYFDAMPEREDREVLKKHGFRWYPAKKCWYAENTAENLEVIVSIFDRLDRFCEETQNIIEKNDAEYDYSDIVWQAGKQCEAILRDIVEHEGITVDEEGYIDTSSDKSFPNYRHMSLLTYACLSPTLLPDEMRRIVAFIRRGRNMAAHPFVMSRDQAKRFMEAFNAFSTWYYFQSGAYKTDQSKRSLVYMKALNANVPLQNDRNDSLPEKTVTRLKQTAITTAGTNISLLEKEIARIISTEVQKGVVEVTNVVKHEAGGIKDKLDELSALVVNLSERIGDYQSLVEKQLKMATSTEEMEHIIHAFTEECVSKMEARFVRNESDRDYTRNRKNLIETLGDVCWERLETRSRTFLISSRIMFDELIMLDDILDYSGVCLLVTKALEYELSKRFYTMFLKYLADEYGKDYSKYPSTMLRWYNGKQTTLLKHDFTLGTVAYIFGFKPDLKPGEDTTQKDYDKCILLDFAEKKLYKNASRKEIEAQIDSFAKDIDEVKSKFRNKAAHTNELKRNNAKECFDIVLDVQKLLKRMIEAFDNTD